MIRLVTLAQQLVAVAFLLSAGVQVQAQQVTVRTGQDLMDGFRSLVPGQNLVLNIANAGFIDAGAPDIKLIDSTATVTTGSFTLVGPSNGSAGRALHCMRHACSACMEAC